MPRAQAPSVDPQFAAARQAPAAMVRPPKPGVSWVVAPVMDGKVKRIRVHKEVKELGSLMASPFVIATTTYLDGTQVVSEYHKGTVSHERKNVGNAAVPVRTPHSIDFGRLTQAATALTQAMASHTPDSPPSPEQQESYIVSYQRLLAWKQAADAAMAQADGQIDIVAAKLRSVMDL